MPEEIDQLTRLNAALAERYRVERELGHGGMATVYLAEDLKHDRPVALKVLRPELAAALGSERFLREIEVTARLNHPHILPLLDSGEAGGFVYYTMPYVEGESLRDRLTREKQLPLDDALQIAREVADALSYAHSHDVVHRDIKPENILLESGHAVVADFGIARAITAAGGERLTETGIAMGTPAYMSPEQAAGSVDLDGRSDLYSLGCVLYEMLAGRPPFVGPTAESMLHQHLVGQPPSVTSIRPAVPGSVEAALDRALAKTPADRFTSVGLFAESIASSSSGPKTVGVHHRALAVVAAAVAITGAAFAMWRWQAINRHVGPPPEDRPYTVLAALEGNADSTSKEAVGFLLRTGLDISYVIQTVEPRDVEHELTLMGRPASAPLDPATARDLAVRLGVPTVVLPRLDRLGGSWVLALRVERVADGQLLAEASDRPQVGETVVEMVDRVLRHLRRELGESRAALTNTDRLPQVLTPSLEALERYREGESLYNLDGSSPRAGRALREAVALDTEFAMAWAKLAGLYTNQSRSIRGSDPDSEARVLSAWREARDRRNRFSDRLTEARRASVKAGKHMDDDIALWDKTMDSWEESVRHDPALIANYAVHIAFFGMADSAVNMAKAALARDVRTARRFDPSRDFSACPGNGWGSAIQAQRTEEFRAFLDSLRVDRPPTCVAMMEFQLSLAQGRWERADSVLRLNSQLSGTEGWMSLNALRGRIAVAHLWAASGRDDRYEQSWQMPALILEVIYGVPGVDTVAALTGRGFQPVKDYIFHGARAALLGDTSEAKRVLGRLHLMRDSATSQRFERKFGPLLAVISAGPAVRREDWHAVIDTLGSWGERVHQPVYGYAGDAVLVWWLLSQAYAELGKTDSSIAELQAIVQPASYLTFAYPLAYSATAFKLGQLYSQKGDRKKALEYYTAFLNAFADPDSQYQSLVEQARVEVARLGRGR